MTFTRFLIVLATTVCWVPCLKAQPGAVDLAFDPGSTTDGAILAIAQLSEGKSIVAGEFQVMHSLLRGRVARLNPDGSVDTTFGNGLDGANNQVAALAVQPDGKVLIAGKFSTVNGVERNRIARLNADGSLDTSFGKGLEGTDGQILAVAVQADGKVLIGGVFSRVNGVLRNNFARLQPDGSLDAGFDVQFIYQEDPGVHAIVVLHDGRLLVSGGFRDISGIGRNKVARFHPDGSVDTEFTPNVFGEFSIVRTLAPQEDGKVIIGGQFTTVSGQSRGNVARLNFNGTLDTNFMAGLSGADTTVEAVAVQAGGKVLVAGYFNTMHDVTRPYIARLDVDGKRVGSYD